MAERIDDTGFGEVKLIQDTDMFCYGIDAVLLADFAARGRHRRIADMGTNNGIIPLLLSELTSASELLGLELQEPAANLARRNIELNGLADRMTVLQCDVADIRSFAVNKRRARDRWAALISTGFTRADAGLEAGPGNDIPDMSPEGVERLIKEWSPAVASKRDILRMYGRFDVVTCNPPYTEKGTGIINAGDALTAARHETTAGLEAFIGAAAFMLKDKGALYMVHRPSRIVDIVWHCRNNGLEPKYIQFISPRDGAKPNLMLVEARKNAGRELKLLDPVSVYDSSGNYTEAINRIYRR